MSRKQRKRAHRGTYEVQGEPGRYATREDAINAATGRLRPGYRWGTGAERGQIIRADS